MKQGESARHSSVDWSDPATPRLFRGVQAVEASVGCRVRWRGEAGRHRVSVCAANRWSSTLAMCCTYQHTGSTTSCHSPRTCSATRGRARPTRMRTASSAAASVSASLKVCPQRALRALCPPCRASEIVALRAVDVLPGENVGLWRPVSGPQTARADGGASLVSLPSVAVTVLVSLLLLRRTRTWWMQSPTRRR
jgi:hypothetical protein